MVLWFIVCSIPFLWARIYFNKPHIILIISLYFLFGIIVISSRLLLFESHFLLVSNIIGYISFVSFVLFFSFWKTGTLYDFIHDIMLDVQSLLLFERKKFNQILHFSELGKIAAGLLHDLSNPLTSMSLAIETASDSYNKKHRKKVFQNSFRDIIQAASVLYEHFYTVKQQLNIHGKKEYIDVAAECEYVTYSFQGILQKREIQVDCEFEEKIFIYGNKIKFRQIISNIISNAIDSCIIKVRGKRLVIRVFSVDGSVVVFIHDTGIGIPRAQQKLIFSPFFTTKQNGVGIGLYRCKEIVEQDFSGKIRFKSVFWYGTSFWVSIPSCV